MRSASFLTVALSWLLVAPAGAQLTVEADGRGIVSVSVGGARYLADLGVTAHAVLIASQRAT